MRISRFMSLAVGLAASAVLATPATAQNPYTSPDDTWIAIDGTVADVMPDQFTLDFGEGLVTVEMDDGDRDADAYPLLEGDSVSVSGKVDDDLFERTTIEASSVFVKNIGTTFYASAVDEENPLMTMVPQVDIPRSVLQGTVTEVRDEEFVLNTGLLSITVRVGEMEYDPLDDEGYQQIEVGDRVSVTGTIDHDFFEGRELVATGITELIN